MKKIVQEWILKAENDYLVAMREFKGEPLIPDAVCFHSQQCIEKYMKAVLEENNKEFEKVHDLNVLLQSCISFIPELENQRKELAILSAYAVDIRYPGISASEEEARECINIMETVRSIMRKYFKLSE